MFRMGMPDWMIEIILPSSKKMDYEWKVKLYREAGAREYWIVDAETEQIEKGIPLPYKSNAKEKEESPKDYL